MMLVQSFAGVQNDKIWLFDDRDIAILIVCNYIFVII